MQTRFERFPASIKGALVMAGADGNPHAVQIESAEVIKVPAGLAKPIPFEDRQLNVAPARDLFVPFEVAVIDLEPGWYRVVSRLRVDGGRSWVFEGRPFTIPWPRNDLRRGVLEVSGRVEVGDRRFEVERVELGGDAAVVVWRPEGQATDAPPGDAVLVADGARLPLVPPVRGSRTFEPRAPGERRTVCYPVHRSTRSLEVVIRLASGPASDPLPIPLG